MAGLTLGAVPERRPTGDALASARRRTLDRLSHGADWDGQLAPPAEILHARPDLVMKDIRGNVDTRLRKLHAGDYDALGWPRRA